MKKILHVILILLFILTVNSCAKKSSDDSSSTNDLLTGTFKLKTFNMSETISSSTTDYPYTVTHMMVS